MDSIKVYNDGREPQWKEICDRLLEIIRDALPAAVSKVWHGAPVWFVDGNPIVGYDVLKGGVRLLFWSGQSFDEPGLKPEGTFKAAEARYTELGQVDADDIRRWLEKAEAIQWDYKNIVKNKGRLGPLKGILNDDLLGYYERNST